MTDEAIELQEKYEKTRALIAEGATSEFWEVLRDLLEDIKTTAKDDIINATGDHVPRLQQLHRAADFIISTVENLKEEQDQIDEKLKKELMTKEEGDDSA